MKIYREESLSNFKFWSGAVSNAEMLTSQELDELENILQDLYDDGMDETTINDLIRFDFEAVCDWLGLEYDSDTGEINR